MQRTHAPSSRATILDARVGAVHGARRAFLPCLVAAALLGSAISPAPAQFGQNKVQYRDRTWSVVKTEHFELYFRDGLRETAVDAGRMAERAYDRLSAMLDHRPEGPIPIVLYGSQTEFQQTNVIPDFLGEGTGGFTEYTKRRVALPLTGSYGDFDHVLTHELVHAFMLDIFAGGRERSLLGTGRYDPPLWLAEGMAEYLSIGEVDPLTEMWLRDGALQGYLTSIAQLERTYDIRIYRYGQALVAYLGATYGDEALGRILKRLPHDRSVDRALEEVVGLRLKKLSEDWTEAVRRQYLPQIRDHQKPEEFSFRLTDARQVSAGLNCTPALAPDGALMAYISDRSLYNDLYVASALTGEIQQRLVKSERRADFESLRFFRSSMDWSPDGGSLVFVTQRGGRDELAVMDPRSGQLRRRIEVPLDGVLSPSFSPDGEWITFAGLTGGRSDLYRVRVEGDRLERLTEDRYLVQEPRYSPDGKKIVFVSDRGVEADFDNLIFSEPRLAFYDLAARKVEVLPAQAGTNISPHFFPDGRHLLFVSDRSGIPNLWIRDLTTSEDRRITDILSGISGVTETSPTASLSRTGNRVVFSAFSRGTWDLFAIKDPLSLWDEGTRWDGPYPVTYQAGTGFETSAGLPAAVEADSTAVVEAEPPEAPPAEVAAVVEEGAPDRFDRLDSLLAAIDSIAPPPGRGPRRVVVPPPRMPGPADTSAPTLAVANVIAENRTLPDSGAFVIDRYRTRFSADYVAANGFFAGNVGVAAQSLLQFSDMLGDQVLVVGASVYGSLSDADLLFEYYNLRRRVTWGVSAFQYRNDYYIYAASSDDEFISQIYRGASLMLQRPFNRFRRLEGSLDVLSVSEEVYRQSFYSGRYDERISRRENLLYLAPGAALVFDNAIWGSTGPISGGRSRYGGEIALGDLNFHNVMFDLRRYLNLRQRYVLAARAIGAVSRGEDPQYFGLGGPYTLRGYPYGEFRGTRAALLNVELRYPLIEYLSLGFPLPLTLGGVRGALFFDAGAAWSEDETFRPFRVTDGILRAESVRASYGVSAGLNVGFTVLRWDLAWRTNLARTLGQPRGYLSLGLDF